MLIYFPLNLFAFITNVFYRNIGVFNNTACAVIPSATGVPGQPVDGITDSFASAFLDWGTSFM